MEAPPAGRSSVARGAIGGDLDQVLQLTDDFVGVILSWVQYSCLLSLPPSLLQELLSKFSWYCKDCDYPTNTFWVISQLILDGFW